jgi:hypothetical protein
MKLSSAIVLVVAILALCSSSYGITPSGEGGSAKSGGIADFNAPVTTNRIEMLEKRVEALKNLGRTGEARDLELLVEEWRDKAVPSVPREPVDTDRGDQVDLSSVKHSNGSMVAFSPWAEDQIIYQGDYAYDAWAAVRKHRPFSLDYDSLGNVYAMVGLPDSSIHVFESTDNGVTWTDELSFVTGTRAFMNNVQLLISDDGPDRIAYTFYLWTGGSGNNLVCAAWDMDSWAYMYSAQLDSAAVDSITNFHATRDHYFGANYDIYVDYQRDDDPDDPRIFQTISHDQGATWDLPWSMQWNSADPCLAYGGYSVGGNLYRAYNFDPAHPESSQINVRVSTDYGFSWQPSVNLRDGGAGNNWDPQVAAANTPRASQMVWVVNSHDWMNSGEYHLWANNSTDGGASWGYPPGPSYNDGAAEYAASIVTYRANDYDLFHLAYIYDDTATTELDSIRVMATDSLTWPPDSTGSIGINDSAYAINVRPMVTYSTALPGVAYGGAAGVNVYYDNVWYVGAEEKATRTRGLEFGLLQNRPNPFSDQTTIHFTLPINTEVSVKVYDVSGRLVRTLVSAKKNAGIHAAIWDGRDDSGALVSNGVYFYRLSSDSGIETRKLNLVR